LGRGGVCRGLGYEWGLGNGFGGGIRIPNLVFINF
jgi:hypothetical protein